MIRKILLTIVVCFLWPVFGWTKSGDLVQVTEALVMIPEELDQIISTLCPNVVSKIERKPVRYFSLVYETTDVRGVPTRASAALLIPPSSEKVQFSVVSYQHGTMFEKAAAPSLAKPWTEGRIVGGCYASQGYAVVVADYLGYGVSNDFHPYHYTPAEGPVTADALRAAKQAAKKLGFELDGKLFLAGYSQGGHVTMALHKYLQENFKSEIKVTASAPMAGAYQLSETARAVLLNPDFNSAIEAAYLLLAFQQVYSLYPSLDQMILPQFTKNLAELLPGKYNMQELMKMFPATPKEMIQPEFQKDLLANSNNALFKALQENDIYNWKPLAPVMLIHGDQDIQVPTFNSILAHETMQKLGAKTELFLIKGKDHSSAAKEAIEKSIQWFNSFQ